MQTACSWTFPSPVDRRFWEKAHDPIRSERPMMEMMTEGNIFPAEGVMVVGRSLFDGKDLLDGPCCKPFVGIKIKYPVTMGTRQGKITLGGKVPVPSPVNHRSTAFFCDFHGPIVTSRVNDKNLSAQDAAF